MTLAAEHLIRLGHKRIAFVGGGRRASPARDRGVGYRETLARYGLPVGPIVNCLPTREEGARAVGTLLRGKRDDPTAVLCYNDVCAFGVLLGLADRGLTAGRDCAVIGFDDIAEAALLPAGPDDRRDRRAPDRRGGGQSAAPPHQGAERRRRRASILPPRLIIRSSCGGQSADLQSTSPASHRHQQPRDAPRRKSAMT